MKKILSFITSIPEEKLTSEVLRKIAIDFFIFEIAIYFLIDSMYSFQIHEDYFLTGAFLLVLGILIRTWRKDFK